MNAQHLLNDQRFLFRDFPSETITIGGTDYSCLCIGARNADELQIGGFSQLPAIQIAIDRNNITEVPETGDTVTFRSKTYRIGEIVLDHPQSPLRFTLESDAT